MPEPRTRSEKPSLHFVFAAHTGNRTARVLKRVLNKIQSEGKKPAFLGLESTVRAKRKIELERATNWLRSANLHLPRVEGTEGSNLPIRLIEAARPRQYRKMRRMKRFPSGYPDYMYEMDFNAALSYTTYGFYLTFNRFMARHDEVLRNLRKEISRMNENEVGVVTYGTFHKGLDRFIASRLGVQTRRTSERTYYQPVSWEVMEKQLAKPRGRKATRDELAQIALESLLSLEYLGDVYEKEMFKRKPSDEVKTLFRNLNRIKVLIKSLSHEDVRAIWEETRHHELIRLPTMAEQGQRLEETLQLIKGTLASKASR